MSKKDFKFTTNFIVKFIELRKSLGIEKLIEYKPNKAQATDNNNFTGFEKNIVTTLDDIFNFLDLRETGQPLLDKNGNCRFIYISDHVMSLSFSYDYRRVHITYCHILRDHDKKERFCSTDRSDGRFEINLKRKKKELKELVKLNVCIPCLSLMDKNNNFDFTKKYGYPDTFNFNKYAQDFKDKYPVEFYSYGEKFDKYDYPKNWGKISFDYRKSVHWICENCGKSCSDNVSNLHVHHINSIRSDCKQSNLKALCIDCHEKEHPHLKRLRR